MPWQTITPMDEITRFVLLAQTDRFTITDLCEQFGISRKTGYKKKPEEARGCFVILRNAKSALRLISFQNPCLLKQLFKFLRRASGILCDVAHCVGVDASVSRNRYGDIPFLKNDVLALPSDDEPQLHQPAYCVILSEPG